MRTAKTLIRLADAQSDLNLRWAHSHFVGFVMRRLIFSNINRMSSTNEKKKKKYVFHFVTNLVIVSCGKRVKVNLLDVSTLSVMLISCMVPLHDSLAFKGLLI